MKILVIGLNYAPDLVGIPKYTTELCEDLVDRGHKVEIITAPPYYPAWEIPAAYRRGRRQVEESNGVTIRRTRLYVPRNPSGLKRLIHLASFALGALPTAIMRACTWRPDVIFTVAPALFSAPVALAAARVSGAKSWLHIQDFELDAAFELGLLKGGAARAIGKYFEGALLRAFDRVSSISPNMITRLLDKGVDSKRAIQLRNWVDIDEIRQLPSSNTSYRSVLGIAPDAPVLLYSGNMSGKQGLDTVADAIRLLADSRPEICTIFCGDGPYRQELEERCKDLGSVRFLPLQPLERLSELLGTADIHLLPQKAEAADLVLPSKLAGILASGRPSIVMAAPATSLADEVEGAGISILPGDAENLANTIVQLVDSTDRCKSLGDVARKTAVARWQKAPIISTFESEIKRLIQPI